MIRASDQFDEQQRQQVNQAVAEAESHTTAEVVPVVASASGRYDRPADVVGLWAGVGVMVIVWAATPEAVREPGAWGGMTPGAKLFWMIIGLLAGFVAGAAVAGHWWRLRWWFTPTVQMKTQVENRARQVFFDASVHHTGGGTGLLIYVSLYEHQAAILADRAIVERLGQTAIDTLCDGLTTRLRSGLLTDALCDTIREAGEQLAKALPRQAETPNELPDTLVLLDEV